MIGIVSVCSASVWTVWTFAGRRRPRWRNVEYEEPALHVDGGYKVLARVYQIAYRACRDHAQPVGMSVSVRVSSFEYGQISLKIGADELILSIIVGVADNESPFGDIAMKVELEPLDK